MKELQLPNRLRPVCGKLLFFMIIIGVSGCGVHNNKVIRPTDDQTAPNVQWDIEIPDTKEHYVVKEENKQADLKEGKTYFTLCKVDDPQGVKKIELKSTANLFCQRNVDNPSARNYYRHKRKRYEVVEQKSYTPDSENMVPPTGFISTNINGNNWRGIDCKNGYISSSVRDYTLECTAWNWSDQTTTRTLKVKNLDVFE